MFLAVSMPTFPGDGGDMAHMQRYEERYANSNSYQNYDSDQAVESTLVDIPQSKPPTDSLDHTIAFEIATQ